MADSLFTQMGSVIATTIDTKADTSAVNTSLALKADTTTVNTALDLKADTTMIISPVVAEDNAIDYSGGINFELTATSANITATNLVSGQNGTIIVHSAENITGWGAEYKFKTVPTDLTGDEVFAYYIEDASNIWVGRVQ